MTNNPVSNFKFLEEEFKDIIKKVRENDHTGRSSNIIAQRKTIVFIDSSMLSITEHIKNNKIDFYFYDWFDIDKNVIMKFHSEPHDNVDYQTETEPYHIHNSEYITYKKRYPNHSFHDLFSILELIRMILIYNKKL